MPYPRNSEEEFFDAEGAAMAAPDALDSLNAKLLEAIELRDYIENIEIDLAAAKKQLHYLNTGIIPDMMAELGMEQVVQRGWQVKISEFVNGTLPKDEDKRAIAVKWLEENGGRDLIKTNVSVSFVRSQHEDALDIAEMIEDEGYAPTVESSVHPQTLAAFAREKMRNGEEIDTELLGLFTGRVAKFKKIGE